MGVILFPREANFLKKIGMGPAGIKARLRRSCTMNTSTGGALLKGAQRARATS
jgi:hypothetical protein